jgi:hypothetical protein
MKHAYYYVRYFDADRKFQYGLKFKSFKDIGNELGIPYWRVRQLYAFTNEIYQNNYTQKTRSPFLQHYSKFYEIIDNPEI